MCSRAWPVEERDKLRAAMASDDDTAGALLDFEDIRVLPASR